MHLKKKLVLNLPFALLKKHQSSLRCHCFVCYVPNCYFTYVKRKLALSPYELNYWQRRCRSLPLRRLDSQETPLAVSNIHKLRKCVCVNIRAHVRFEEADSPSLSSGSIQLVISVTLSLNISVVQIYT